MSPRIMHSAIFILFTIENDRTVFSRQFRNIFNGLHTVFSLFSKKPLERDSLAFRLSFSISLCVYVIRWKILLCCVSCISFTMFLFKVFEHLPERLKNTLVYYTDTTEMGDVDADGNVDVGTKC